MPSTQMPEMETPGVGDLNTPTLFPSAAPGGLSALLAATRNSTPISGLFDPLETSGKTTATDPATTLTTARALDLATLDPQELDSLLADLEPGHPKETPLTPPVRDHDYCEDWGILQEFIDITKPCLDRTDSAQIRDFSGLLDDRLPPAEEAPAFPEGLVDLEPILLGSITLGPEPQVQNVVHLDEDSSWDVASTTDSTAPYDPKYRERRNKNNVASAASRRTRKEKRMAMEAEREELAKRNGDLKADVERLEALAAEWKERLLTLIG